MRRALSACAFALSLLFGASMTYGADTANDPCLGPRGDKTFTFPEFMKLFSAELSPDKTTYKITWPCGKEDTFNFLVGREDIGSIDLGTKEIVHPYGLWSTGKKETTYSEVTLFVTLESSYQEITVGDKTARFNILSTLIPISRWSENLSSPSYREWRKLRNALAHAFRTSADRTIFLKGVRVKMTEMREPYTYDKAGTETAYAWPSFYTPTAILHGTKVLWQKKP